MKLKSLNIFWLPKSKGDGKLDCELDKQEFTADLRVAGKVNQSLTGSPYGPKQGL